MCGIFGWQFPEGSTGNSRLILASILAFEMDKRGGHSWGLYDPTTDWLKKGLGELSRLRAGKMARHSTLLAHTRWATTGDVTTRNAHPFRFAKLVGAHNGVVSNHAVLNLAYGRNCEVDSMHIFLHLEDDLPLCEIKAYGAIQYVWTDQPEKVHLGAFNGGELEVYKVGDGLVWASTFSPIEAALSLAGLSGYAYQLENDVLYVAEKGQLTEDQLLDISPYRTPKTQSLLETDLV